MSLEDWIQKIDNLVWGPWLLVLLLGTGIYLTVRLRFLSVRNLKYAMKCVLGSDKDETRNEYELSATENYKKNKS